MKKLLLIKTGTTYPHLSDQFGDFDTWIIDGMGAARSEVEVVEVFRNSGLPASAQTGGIVISGSHAMVTDRPGWVSRTAGWLTTAVDKRIPVLGICFGHQLLATAFGGEVAFNPKGKEFGTVRLTLTTAAGKDPLFGHFASGIPVQTSHAQTVTKLPRNAVLLASSDMEAHQAFRIHETAWGIQFHPEFNASITKSYINHESELLRNPNRLKSQCRETPEAASILEKFYELSKRYQE